MSHRTPAPLPVLLEELALLIIRNRRFVNTGYTSGSILASDGKAWRYLDDRLVEVPWSDYECAVNSGDRKEWPPYTITLENLQVSEDGQSVWLDVTTVYDMGMVESSRGGNESRVLVKYGDGGWHIAEIEALMDWD